MLHYAQGFHFFLHKFVCLIFCSVFPISTLRCYIFRNTYRFKLKKKLYPIHSLAEMHLFVSAGDLVPVLSRLLLCQFFLGSAVPDLDSGCGRGPAWGRGTRVRIAAQAGMTQIQSRGGLIKTGSAARPSLRAAPN